MAAGTSEDPRPAALRYPCFWTRGLIPNDWLSKGEEPQQQTKSFGEFSKSQWNVQGQTVYVDESAGIHSSNPHLRRCGYGLVILDDKSDVTSAYSSTLGGDEQTQFIFSDMATGRTRLLTDGVSRHWGRAVRQREGVRIAFA